MNSTGWLCLSPCLYDQMGQSCVKKRGGKKHLKKNTQAGFTFCKILIKEEAEKREAGEIVGKVSVER